MTPLEEFALMMKYAGVTAYHDAGFKGQGINVLNCEQMSFHGELTGHIINLVAPACNFFCADLNVSTDGDTLIDANLVTAAGDKYDLAEYIKTFKIDIMSMSRSGDVRCKEWVEYCIKMQQETGVVIFNSAANEGLGDGETIETQFPYEVANIVAAAVWNGGYPKRANYSSVGQELDFIAFAGLAGGTSCATPFLAAQLACIFSRYRKMTPAESRSYLKSISKDLGAIGFDTHNGEGMPIMLNKTQIKLQIGSLKMYVDNVLFMLDQAPIIDRITGRTLVPVRAVSEAFGAKVTWDQVTKSITLDV